MKDNTDLYLPAANWSYKYISLHIKTELVLHVEFEICQFFAFQLNLHFFSKATNFNYNMHLVSCMLTVYHEFKMS